MIRTLAQHPKEIQQALLRVERKWDMYVGEVGGEPIVGNLGGETVGVEYEFHDTGNDLSDWEVGYYVEHASGAPTLFQYNELIRGSWMPVRQRDVRRVARAIDASLKHAEEAFHEKFKPLLDGSVTTEDFLRDERCDYCGGWLRRDEESDRPIPHDHTDDSPDSSLTAELRYARRGDY